MKKKVLLLIALLLPLATSAQESEIIDGIHYYLSPFKDCYVVLDKPEGYSGEITIPSTLNGKSVKEIAERAFYNNQDVTMIHLPYSLDKIQIEAFSGCSGISSIEIPQNVRFVDDKAFANCKNLKDVYCFARPTMGNDVFLKTKGFILHVPADYIAYFREHKQWKNAKEIVEINIESWALQQHNAEVRQKRIQDSIAAREKFLKDSIEAIADISAAENGDSKAQLRLGNRYSNGEGVKKDHSKAFAYYRQAAENGNVIAQVKLGTIYYKGYGDVKKDEKAAMFWYKKAAAQGNSDAEDYIEAYHEAKGEVVFPQGFVVNPDKSYIMFPDSVIFECTELWSSGGRFEKWNAKTKIQRATIRSISIPDDIIPKGSSKDIEELIKEKVSIVFPQIKRNNKIDHEGIVLYEDDIEVLFGRVSPPNGGEQYRALRVFGSDTDYGKEIGYFKENKYTSVKAIEAEEKNEALRVANFKKKYGFDPNSSGRQVIKAGRKITALDAWGEWKKEKYSKTSLFSDMPWKYSLSIDHGASKCYDLVFNISVKGFMWVRNGDITSVVWY